MTQAVCRQIYFFSIGALLAGLMSCAATARPRADLPAELYDLKQQFAGGNYETSLQGCLLVINGRPGCAALDQALYYAALNSLRIEPGQAGRIAAAGYLGRLAAECPASPRRPEAELWLELLGSVHSAPGAEQNAGLLKDQELERLQGEIQRLNHELDLLKNVDLQLHRQKKDLDNGPDQRKNSRP